MVWPRPAAASYGFCRGPWGWWAFKEVPHSLGMARGGPGHPAGSGHSASPGRPRAAGAAPSPWQRPGNKQHGSLACRKWAVRLTSGDISATVHRPAQASSLLVAKGEGPGSTSEAPQSRQQTGS